MLSKLKLILAKSSRYVREAKQWGAYYDAKTKIDFSQKAYMQYAENAYRFGPLLADHQTGAG